MDETKIFDGVLKVRPTQLRGTDKLIAVDEMPPFKTLVETSHGEKIEDTSYYRMFISRGNTPEEARRYTVRFIQAKDKNASDGNVGSVSITIDAHGNMVINSGYENAAIAAYVGIPQLDVEVKSRDPKWIDLVTRLYDVRDSRSSYMPIFQPEEHPEFRTWKFARGHERAKIISKDMKGIKGQKWLDVGSLTGYHSRMLSFAGAHVRGVEMHKPYAEIAGLLNGILGTDVVYHIQELPHWLAQNSKNQFNGILCLSIIHNIAQQGNPKGAKQAFMVLSKMSPLMYFDIGQANEGSRVTSTGLDLSEGNLERFARENSAYTSATIIGRDTTYYNRALFRLTR